MRKRVLQCLGLVLLYDYETWTVKKESNKDFILEKDATNTPYRKTNEETVEEFSEQRKQATVIRKSQNFMDIS